MIHKDISNRLEFWMNFRLLSAGGKVKRGIESIFIMQRGKDKRQSADKKVTHFCGLRFEASKWALFSYSASAHSASFRRQNTDQSLALGV